MSNHLIAPLLLASALAAAPALAKAPAEPAPVMLQVGQPLPRAALLTAGTHRYARYVISGDGRALLDLWSRTVSFEVKDGRRLMRIRQRWDAADKSYVVTFDQLFEAGTFRPISQTQTGGVKDRSQVFSVVFDGAKVDSTSDAAAGAAKPLHQTFDMAFYNFHTDMEMLQALPLKAGYVVSIPFYDTGRNPPARYLYRVTGEAAIPGPDGAPIKCWLVTFQSKPTNPVTRFWFAQRNQVLVREETDIPGKGTLVKTLLNAEAGDGAG